MPRHSLKNNLFDFSWYAPRALKIKTKTAGLMPFVPRKYQLRYIHHLNNDFDSNIVRSIVLKPRQAGFSTLVAGFNIHRMNTIPYYTGIMLADKFARTNEVHGIYSTMVANIPDAIRPMIAAFTTEEILFDNPDKQKRVSTPGMGSGFKSETAQDPNAGRSGSRQWAHLTEYAFYPYATEVDEGVQNSIPLAPGTFIVKESTAFGMSGTGEAFYHQWMAAERGDSNYRPFFVAWYEVDDYQLEVPPGFILNKDEVDLLARCPTMTHANLAWRRLKLREYISGEASIYSPEERFKQDFPSYPEEAFLSTGRPVFDQGRIKLHLDELRRDPPPTPVIQFKREWLARYRDIIHVYRVPKNGKKYAIGADVAEGVEGGDYSSAKVIDEDGNECAKIHGHLDPDHFGEVLVDMGIVYNMATLTPEINNMGYATLEAIRRRNYPNVYMRAIHDELVEGKETHKMGWRTTASSKQLMISALVSAYRDGDGVFLDTDLLREMMGLSREPDGGVKLTGKDRVVAACLARMGLRQIREATVILEPGKKEKILFETKDLYREKVHGRSTVRS